MLYIRSFVTQLLKVQQFIGTLSGLNKKQINMEYQIKQIKWHSFDEVAIKKFDEMKTRQFLNRRFFYMQ